MLVASLHESSEVFLFFLTFVFITNMLKDSFLNSKDMYECMFPKLLDLVLGHNTALLVAYFDNLTHNLIELKNVSV